MSFYEEKARNGRVTYLLFLAFFILIVCLGVVFSYILGSYLYVPIFGLFAIIYMLASYYYSDKLVAAISGAKEVAREQMPKLHDIIEEMSIASGLPKPKVYMIEDTAINAFATGRNPEHSLVCVTTGAVQSLTRQELTGVIAHEMSHIKNYDTRVMTIAAVMVGIAVLMSDFLLRMFLWGGRGHDRDSGKAGLVMIVVGLLLAILTPIIAQIIQLAISRSREYLADASAAEMTRYPEGLAGALEKIGNDKEILEAANKATAPMYIADPLKGQKLFLKGLFSTHPPIGDRIAKLRAM